MVICVLGIVTKQQTLMKIKFMSLFQLKTAMQSSNIPNHTAIIIFGIILLFTTKIYGQEHDCSKRTSSGWRVSEVELLNNLGVKIKSQDEIIRQLAWIDGQEKRWKIVWLETGEEQKYIFVTGPDKTIRKLIFHGGPYFIGHPMFDSKQTLKVSSNSEWTFYWLEFGTGRVGVATRLFILIAHHRASGKWNAWCDSMDGDDDLILNYEKTPEVQFSKVGPEWRDVPKIGRIYTPERIFTWKMGFHNGNVTRLESSGKLNSKRPNQSKN